MVEECEVCGQTEFTAEAGFHYCVECGTKSQRHGTEMVVEFDENAGGKQGAGAAVIKIKKGKKKSKMITSWEQLNYILLGYTDRLVSVGAGEDFKLTVLQLWTTYLRRMEVAFFDKQKPERPRLQVFHKSMDAEILYNRRKKKPRVRNAKETSKSSAGTGSRPASEAASSTSRNTSTLRVRSEQRSLLNAEYDSFRASQQSDVNRSLHELSVRSMNASLSESESGAGSSKSEAQRIKFSRLARIRMKRTLKMSTSHINKHEKDLDDRMTCHSNKGKLTYTDKQKPGKKKLHPENLTRMMLVSILGLGLNASQSDVQLADVVRFHRYHSKPAYELLRTEFHYPLPSLRCLREWASHINMRKGVLEDVLTLLNIAGSHMTEREKICALVYDEMSVQSTSEYDKKNDEVIGPHSEMQVVMARGLLAQWKQPIFVNFDMQVTKQLLDDLITRLYNIGFTVMANVHDCGTGNRGVWRDCGVNHETKQTAMKHPCTGKDIFFFPDAPHLYKLFRNWLLDDGFLYKENQDSPAQTDMTIREEHISHTNLMQYLPEELDPSCCTETFSSLQKGLSFSHNELRAGVMQLVKFLNVDPITPDLQKLCKRYLDELCLPADLMIFLKRLMDVFPPKMPFDGCSHLPNYEGRAMAFIIFMLKLLFGLNDTTEMKLSKSAAKFNQTLTNLGPSYRPLFVFREWIRYLEMRRVILAQVHHPTNRLMAKEEGIEQDADLFINHNMRKKQGGDKFRMSAHQVNQNWMSKMKDAVTNMVDTHHRLNVTREPQPNIDFEPSLTSNRSYFETFLLAYNRDGRIHVPDFMREHHSDRAIFPLVSPSDLKQLLRTDHQITLKTKKVPSALSQLELVDTAVVLDFVANQVRREPPFQLVEDCEESGWTPPAKRSRPVRTHEEILARILIRNQTESELTQLHLNSLPPNPAPPSEADETATNVTMSTTADTSGLATSQDSFIAPYQNSTHTLLTPNYDYWIRFFQGTEITSMETFDERIATGLPGNFRLVLEECARVIENHPSVLYRELMALETYFFHAVQPVERWFDGTEHCEVQLETNWKKDRAMFRRVGNAVKEY